MASHTVAYLILAHRQPAMLFRLATDLASFQPLLRTDTLIWNITCEARSSTTSPADKRADRLFHEEPFHLTYLDWSPHRELPAILDERDLDCLRDTACLFARKFDENRSADLLKQLFKGTAD